MTSLRRGWGYKRLDLERDWMVDGSCYKNSEFARWFFSYDHNEQDRAIEVCKNCPVRPLCYAYAIVYEEAGIWGGTMEQTRFDRRRHIVSDVAELWPRLYNAWRHETGRPEAPPPGTAPEPEAVVEPPPLTEPERARLRARLAAYGGSRQWWSNS